MHLFVRTGACFFALYHPLKESEYPRPYDTKKGHR